MGILLGCGEGLLILQEQWQRLPCPLHQVTHAACDGVQLSAIDDHEHLLWHGGRLLSCDGDIEALQLWQGHALTLSSNTDCLSIAHPQEGWIVTARVGMYPQDMYVQDGTVFVCGGADGLIHLLSLPELFPLGEYAVPGMPQRVAVSGDTAHLLCAAADEEMQCLYCHLLLSSGECRQQALLTGLPGAVCCDGSGGAWIAASERLYHFPAQTDAPDIALDGFGLARHIDMQDDAALVTDPLEGTVTLVKGMNAHVIYQGDAAWAGFCLPDLHVLDRTASI